MRIKSLTSGNNYTIKENKSIVEERKSMKREIITIGIGNKVETDEVRKVVKKLQDEGYLVYAPFYIVNYLGQQGLEAATNYLKDSIAKSDIFYIINVEEPETEILTVLRGYAEKGNKKIMYS